MAKGKDINKREIPKRDKKEKTSEALAKKEEVKTKPSEEPVEEETGELQENVLYIKTEKEIPEKICVFKDRRGRIIIETACGMIGTIKTDVSKTESKLGLSSKYPPLEGQETAVTKK
jgi:cation transport regulator ChaC